MIKFLVWTHLLAFLLGGAFDVYAQMASSVSLPIKLEVKKNVTLKKSEIMLADITECIGAQVKCDETYGISIGSAPEPGRSTIISQNKLQKIVRLEWPETQTTISGNKSVKISTAFIKLSNQDIMDRLTAVLNEKFTGGRNIKLTVEYAKLTTPVKLLPIDHSIEIPFLSKDKIDLSWVVTNLIKKNSMQVTLRPIDNLENEKSTRIITKFSLMQKLPVAATFLTRNHVISYNDIEEKWVKVQSNNFRFLTSKKKIVGKTVRHSHSIGKPFTSTSIKVNDLIRRGELVNILVKKGSISLRVRGKALDSGAYGDRIKVTYPQTGKQIQAKIIGRNQVRAL